MKIYCKTCKKGHEENLFKKTILVSESIIGGSYTILTHCPLGHEQ